MLTIRHFEAIGKLVYQSSIMELRLCHLMLVLKAHLNGQEEILACLSEAEDLHSRRNDIVHGLWQLPAESLFGKAWQDILGTAPTASALRVPAKKGVNSYFVSYTAEQIEEVAEHMQSITVQLVALSSFGSDA